jgi:hypothetical protein
LALDHPSKNGALAGQPHRLSDRQKDSVVHCASAVLIDEF